MDVRDQLYGRIGAIRTLIFDDPDLPLPVLKSTYQGLRLNFLEGDAAAIAGAAQLDSPSGVAHRYALRELNPFVITGNEAVYADHNVKDAEDIGFLAIENFSDEYINDRVAMLQWKIKQNVGDLDVLTGPGLKTYDDRITGENITVSQDGGLHLNPTVRIIFGSDESENGVGIPAIVGTNDTDHIYGGLGDDTIMGEGDYLEGGAGDDSITGGAGIDKLVGGRGDDILHLEGGASPFVGDSDGEERSEGLVTISTGDYLAVIVQSMSPAMTSITAHSSPLPEALTRSLRMPVERVRFFSPMALR